MMPQWSDRRYNHLAADAPVPDEPFFCLQSEVESLVAARLILAVFLCSVERRFSVPA
jgi:hypothetical protein